MLEYANINPEAYEVFELVVSSLDLEDDDVSDELYRALCNNEWHSESYGSVSYSWRAAGGLLAELRDKGECYLDFYGSGGEGIVSLRIAKLLSDLDWFCLPV